MHVMIIFLNLCSLVILLISFRDHQENEKTYRRKTKKIESACLLFYLNLYTRHFWWGCLGFLLGMRKKIFHVSLCCKSGIDPACSLSTAVTPLSFVLFVSVPYIPKPSQHMIRLLGRFSEEVVVG